jgi:hypothetical protein
MKEKGLLSRTMNLYSTTFAILELLVYFDLLGLVLTDPL